MLENLKSSIGPSSLDMIPDICSDVGPYKLYSIHYFHDFHDLYCYLCAWQIVLLINQNANLEIHEMQTI